MRALSLRSMQLAANSRLPYNTPAVARKKVQKVESITHDHETRPNNPSAEMEGLMKKAEAQPVKVGFPRKHNTDAAPEMNARNPDLDPQLVWKGKDDEDRSPLTVDAVPIYVQEKILPKAIIDDLLRRSRQQQVEAGEEAPDLFEDWANELNPEERVDFYAHQQKWANRMILGDSLLVMTSLAEKEGMRGGVQCIYCDPPYGINYSANWQHNVRSRNLQNTNAFLAREPEVVRAFRDTWRYGIHSYLSYIRDRLVISRDLLRESGSFFLQIGDENEHLLRSLLDEVFGKDNFVSKITYKKRTPLGSASLPTVSDNILWYAKKRDCLKSYKLHEPKMFGGDSGYTSVRSNELIDRKMTRAEKKDPKLIDESLRVYCDDNLASSGYTKSCYYDITVKGRTFKPTKYSWRTNREGMARLIKADRIIPKRTVPSYRLYFHDCEVKPIDNLWHEVRGTSNPIYVVQTNPSIIERCLLMSTDPGDLVLDPTCGSGTTAFVAEKWGRKWITIDTSRVALALARARLIGSGFDYYLLWDSKLGHDKEAELAGHESSSHGFTNNLQHGFVYQRCPHITLKSIAHNKQIDTIWDRWQGVLEPLREELNMVIGQSFEEWEIPAKADSSWSDTAIKLHGQWQQARVGRQAEIDASILDNAETELLRDMPCVQDAVLRVAGPFTVESLSPHRVLPTDAQDDEILAQLDDADELSDQEAIPRASRRLRPKSEEVGETKFLDIVFQSLRNAGVQNTKKKERLEFTSLEPWSRGRHIQFEGRYVENGRELKGAVCVGPEYGIVTRSLMVHAARESADYFDSLIVLGFAFEAHADEDLLNVGKMPIMRARMNNDLHMADKLKAGKSGNLFVVFGEPDIRWRKLDDGRFEVRILGVDIFNPTTGEVKEFGPEEIACWFIDTDYNDEAFFVRHTYFSGGGPDPFKQLKSVLRADVNQEAWASIYAPVSRPFPPPFKRQNCGQGNQPLRR